MFIGINRSRHHRIIFPKRFLYYSPERKKKRAAERESGENTLDKTRYSKSVKINLFLFIIVFTTRRLSFVFEESTTREMTSVVCVFPKKRNESTPVCLGYQCETLKQHEANRRAALFKTSHVSEKYAYEYCATPSERETETEK